MDSDAKLPAGSSRPGTPSTSALVTSVRDAAPLRTSEQPPSSSTSPILRRSQLPRVPSGRDVGHLDVLINNAGIAGDQQAPGTAAVEDLEHVMATNVIGAARLLDACTPLLELSAAPNVVNVSSAVGSLALNAEPNALWSMLAYPMSKAALNMLTIQYARAYPRWRVNSVTPGLTNSDFIARDVGAPVEEAVEIIVRTAMAGTGGPTGTFRDISNDIPW